MFSIFQLVMIAVFFSGTYFLGAVQKSIEEGEWCVTACEAEVYMKLPEKEVETVSGKPLLMKEACGIETQVILNERLRIIQKDIQHNGTLWAHVRMSEQTFIVDGNPKSLTGYIRQDKIEKMTNPIAHNATIKDMWVPVYTAPFCDMDYQELERISCGVRLFCEKTADPSWYKISYAGGKEGFVHAHDCVTDQRIAAMSVDERRNFLRNVLDNFIMVSTNSTPWPYRWGGRSLGNFDCSGVVQLVYRLVGLSLPRNSHDQFLVSKPLKLGTDLQLGDLIFLQAPRGPEGKLRTVHVMIYLNDDLFLESQGFHIYSMEDMPAELRHKTGMRVISGAKHDDLKAPLKELASGQKTSDYTVFFGTVLGSRTVYKKFCHIKS